MKTIIIESVSNGYLVRPFHYCPDWAASVRSEIAVFNNLADLQAALPDLLVDEKLSE